MDEDVASDDSGASYEDSDADSDFTPVSPKKGKKSFRNVNPVQPDGLHDESYRDKVLL